MIKILFVCHGNICRSPLAEFVMKDLVKKKGLEKEFFIHSAATSAEELGNPVYPPIKRILKARNISCDEKYAVRMTKDDYGAYDMLICMDGYNLKNMMRIVGSDPMNKISLLMDHTSTPHDVADPWYSGNFDATEKDVDEGCAALLDHLLKTHPELKNK